jgi:hypothetical protein
LFETVKQTSLIYVKLSQDGQDAAAVGLVGPENFR